MKKKNIIIAAASAAAVLAAAFSVGLLYKSKGENLKKTGEEPPQSSEIVLDTDDIEDIESETETESEESGVTYVTPDEEEADRLLEEAIRESEEADKKEQEQKEEAKLQASEKNEVADEANTVTFEEGKKELENTAAQYLKEHNIDPKTAGETGETCPNCGKKIWNPDKYGLFIPGMPEDYENSGYCLGTCGIVLS